MLGMQEALRPAAHALPRRSENVFGDVPCGTAETTANPSNGEGEKLMPSKIIACPACGHPEMYFITDPQYTPATTNTHVCVACLEKFTMPIQ